MNDNDWHAVDIYLADRLVPADPALAAALEANAAAGLPAIDVSPLQGQFLALLVAMTGASRVLEIGTLGGYSTLFLARALPEGGVVVSLEKEPRHAEVARANVAAAGLGSRIDLRVGDAVDTLAAMQRDGEAPFDLVFIDADKPNNPAYFAAAMALSRPGTVLVFDNVVRQGHVVDGASRDASVEGVRATVDLVAADPRLEATAMQTVGIKGWDGMMIARVKTV